MAYFSNGSDGRDYQEAYCNRCVHDENNDCPIWNLHLMYNGEEAHQPLLDALIPPVDEITIGECRFFTLSTDLARGQRADQLYFQWQQDQATSSATTPEESKPRRPQLRKIPGGQKTA